jgi:hypothetical protein
MVSDKQVKRLMKLIGSNTPLYVAAAKSGMDEKTARKYVCLEKLPSEVEPAPRWRSRPDPFAEVWEEVREHLEANPGLEAKTLFGDLQRRYPGRFSEGQLRTLQRRIKRWRALEGPAKEVFFPQYYVPGERCQSDFTDLSGLAITLSGSPFEHLIYHFVLPYSNWETGVICFSESFESLSEGLQTALWRLGGVPRYHQTDRLSAAVHKAGHPQAFTQRYEGLLRHYGLQGRKTNAASPHENGDVEQRHHRFKQALEQALLLRGSRDFADRDDYDAFLRKLFGQLNRGRSERFAEEQPKLRALPAQRLAASKRLVLKVGPSSTIRVNHNIYSVHSRLIGETIEVRVFAERLEIWYAQRCVERLPRLRGEEKAHIQYRHIIDWLARKPGAFAHYRYREALYPSSRFRLAYDQLHCCHSERQADRLYLAILRLAAYESEVQVEAALETLLGQDQALSVEAIEQLVRQGLQPAPATAVEIAAVDLSAYDALLFGEVA